MMGKVKSATLLFDGSEMILSKFWNGDNKPFVAKDDLFMNFGMPIQLTYPLPDPRNTVVKIELIK